MNLLFGWELGKIFQQDVSDSHLQSHKVRPAGGKLLGDINTRPGPKSIAAPGMAEGTIACEPLTMFIAMKMEVGNRADSAVWN